MSWQDAEVLAQDHMRRLGFRDATVTASGPDGGLDVVGKQAVAQVKHYATPLGAPAVQQTVGAASGAAWVLFYSLAGYTRSATDFAERAKVALFRYHLDGRIEPVNEVATFLSRNLDPATDKHTDAFYAADEIRRETQSEFERAWRAFTELARGCVHDAKLRGGPTPASRAAESELDRVRAAVDYVGQRTLPVNVVLDHIEVIDQATARLRSAM